MPGRPELHARRINMFTRFSFCPVDRIFDAKNDTIENDILKANLMYGRNSRANVENEKIVFRVSRSPGFLTKILKDHQDPEAPKPAWATVIPNFRIKIKEAEDASAEVLLTFLLS